MPILYSKRILGHFPYVYNYPQINKIQYYYVATLKDIQNLNISLNRMLWNYFVNFWFGYSIIAAVYIRVAITHYERICNEMMWCEHNATAKTMIKFIIFVSSIVLSIWVVSVKQELPFALGLAYCGFILCFTVFVEAPILDIAFTTSNCTYDIKE